MDYRFEKHYTRDEARALLPRVREWLQRLNHLRHEQERFDKRLTSLMSPGHDVGGDLVNNWIRTLAEMQQILGDFQQRQIQIKDLERGLLDFPSLIGGKEVFLCWEQDEEDIEHWHDLDAGFAGRVRL
jgi:hypothetical protein